jgi:AhpD family alkylhydroperoxidase
MLESAPEIFQAALKLGDAIAKTGLDKHYAHLIAIRASQINGCAYCINMHAREARKAGMSEWKIYLLSAWRESTIFDAKERAVLAWTDALTRASEAPFSRESFSVLMKHFSELEIVGINSAVALINFWNRTTLGLGIVHPAEKNAE